MYKLHFLFWFFSVVNVVICMFQANRVCGQSTRPDSGVWFEGRPIKRNLFRREVAGNDKAASEWDIHTEALLPKHGL